MTGFKLTLALEHYDRHLPLLDGNVVPAGIDLHVAHVTVEEGRHERMIDHREWDACELSLSSYLYGLDQGLIDCRLEVEALFHETTHST